MVAKGASKYLVPQLSCRLKDRRLDRVVRVSTDPRLTRLREGADSAVRLSCFSESSNQHRHELHDIGTLRGTYSVSSTAREVGLELTHAFVDLVSGAVKAENQGAPLPFMAVVVGFPGASMRMRKVAYETRLPRVWVEGVSSDGDGVWSRTAESGDGHV